MYVRYDDILSRISEPPTWWSHGVPRYGTFSPDAVDIYARCVALVHTKCCCGTDYHQATVPRDIDSFKNGITLGEAPVGDPPNACLYLRGRECGSASDTCRLVGILEFWERDDAREALRSGIWWRRLSEYELPLTDHFEAPPRWEPVHLSPEQLAAVTAAHAQGGKIAAVKAVADMAGVGLSSARYWVDNKFL